MLSAESSKHWGEETLTETLIHIAAQSDFHLSVENNIRICLGSALLRYAVGLKPRPTLSCN